MTSSYRKCEVCVKTSCHNNRSVVYQQSDCFCQLFREFSLRAKEMPFKQKYREKSGHKREHKNTVIDINDVLEELSEENNRLLNELLFANKCLKMFIQFKTFVDFISNKFKLNLETNELEKYEEFNEDINQIVVKRNLNFNSINCISIVKREPSEDENEDIAEEERHLSENQINKNNEESFDCSSDTDEYFDGVSDESEDSYLSPNDETMASDSIKYDSETEEEVEEVESDEWNEEDEKDCRKKRKGIGHKLIECRVP